MLELDDLHIANGDFRLVADLRVSPRRKVAVIGPSGGGKSTFLGAIVGFVPTRSGHMRWNGAEISLLPPGQRPVAMIFQDHNLFPQLNAWRNVALGLSSARRLRPDQADRVAAALNDVGLQGLENRRPAELSGGQQARVALARVLVQDRPLWLLDEPFAALGPALRRDMLDLVARAADRQGATVLLVTHAPADAWAFADEMIFVDGGRAEPPIPIEAAREHPTEGLRRYLGLSDPTQ